MAPSLVRRPTDLHLRNLCGIYTVAPEMEEVFRLVTRAARADCTILLDGETGTGKELAGRAVHHLGARKSGPFRALNCATLSPTLLESELFGHVRGAFTGAIRDKKGELSLADHGTFFLDEVAEIPIDIQGRLLRVLQDRTFVPIGGTRPLHVDVRLVSATNKQLSAEVDAGRFRADLAYRIRVVPLHMPPLRERSGDVEALFWHFVDEANEKMLRHVEAVTPAAMEALRTYQWPGNVRELRNTVEYTFVVGEGPVIGIDDMPPELRGERPSATDRAQLMQPMRSEERARLLAALEHARWRRVDAAAALGVSRSTLWRRMREFGLDSHGHHHD